MDPAQDPAARDPAQDPAQDPAKDLVGALAGSVGEESQSREEFISLQELNENRLTRAG